MSNYQVESEASGSSSGFVNGGKIVPTDGTYYYFNRQGWSNKDSELKTTTKAAVAPGNYYFVFDYKAADYSNNNNAGPNGTTIGITVKDASSNTIATLPAAKLAYSKTNGDSNPGSDAYMHNAPWSKKGIAFTVTSSSVLTFAVQQNMRNSGRSDIVYDNFKLYKIDDASNVDFTGYIANPGFEAENTNGWTGTNDGGDPAFSQGNKQQWNGSFSFSQPLAGLPNGKYKITVQGFYRPGGNGAELNAQNALLFAGNATEPLQYVSSEAKAEKDTDHGFTTAYGELGYVPNSQTDAKKAFEYGAYDGNELSFYVTNHTITVGTKKDVKLSNDWTVWDNFKLYLQELAIENYAETYVASVTADKWYVYDVSANGDYRFISNVANTITYTQTGTDIDGDVSTTENLTAGTKKVVTLTAGKVYFKVSGDATLTVEPDSYSYSVGEGTPSVANNAYIQSNTVTITFANATTNDPDGELSILDASKIKVNDVAASASIDGKVLTITLASPLATSTDYAVSIEAGAVGYNADNANATISLMAKTPAVFDGTYFIATTDGIKFISRGGDSNTEATLDEFGIAVNFTTDASNVTMLQLIDNERYIFGGSSTVYTDRIASDENVVNYGKWTVAAVADGYSFYNTGRDKYIKAGTGTESKKDAATYDDAAYTWKLVAPADHAAIMATYKDANAAAVASAAGLTSTTTVSALETALSSNFTSESVAPTNAYSSVTEKYQPGGYTEKIIEQEYSGLKNGIYKVSISAFHRIKDNAGTYACHQNNTDNPTSYLYANNQRIQLPSSMSEYSNDAYTGGDNPNWAIDGKNYPNNTTAAGTAFDADRYKVEVFAVVTDGTLKLGLTDPGKYTDATWQYNNWICYRDLSITAYVFNGDYTDLNNAITTAEASIGFEAGEYAPYNNVVSMGKLASAKALYASQDAINQSAIDEVKTALTSATWTNANAEEVNAIYDGDFDAAKDNVATNTLPTGWHGSDSHYSDGYWCRYVYSDGSSNAGLTHFTNGSAMMSKSTPRYGLDDGYTMPLKADTYYTISFDFAGWNSELVTTVVITDGEGEQVTVTPSQTEKSAYAGQTNTGDWKSYTGVFKTNAAGNYVLKFDKKELNGNGGQVAYGAIKLFKASSANMKITDAQWATFCAPFDVTIPDGVTAYTVTGTSGNELTTTVVETTIPANTPVLLNSESVVNETFYGKFVESENITNGLLTGVYTDTEAPVGKYVLMNDKDNGLGFYIVESGEEPTIDANRAYLTVPGSSRVAFFFDGKSTGLNDVRAKMSEVRGDIYNLNGQRVTTPKRGLYIVNGKKVVVK